MDQLPLALKQRVAHLNVQDVSVVLDQTLISMTWRQVNAEGEWVMHGIQGVLSEPYDAVLDKMAEVCAQCVDYDAMRHARL